MLRLRRRGQSAAARQRAALGKLLTAARGLVCRRTRFLLGRLLTRRSLRSIALAEHLGRAAFAEGDATLRGCHKITSPRRTRGTWYGGARRAAATTRLRLATGLMATGGGSNNERRAVRHGYPPRRERPAGRVGGGLATAAAVCFFGAVTSPPLTKSCAPPGKRTSTRGLVTPASLAARSARARWCWRKGCERLAIAHFHPIRGILTLY